MPLYDDGQRSRDGLAGAEMGGGDDDDEARATRLDRAQTAATEGNAGNATQRLGYRYGCNTMKETVVEAVAESPAFGHYGRPIVSLPGRKKKLSSAGTSRGLSSR